MIFSTNQPETAENQWKGQIDRFVKENQQELAALFWGLWLENGNSQGTIGINLKPHPHFVYCPQVEIEKLNNNVENRLQEILGIIANHNPEIEVVMIAIGIGEIKLIQFAPEIPPATCFQQLGKDVESLLDLLENRMNKKITIATISN